MLSRRTDANNRFPGVFLDLVAARVEAASHWSLHGYQLCRLVREPNVNKIYTKCAGSSFIVSDGAIP